MKKKELTDLKVKTAKDLIKLAGQKSTDAKKLKLDILSGKEKNLKAYRNMRKDIAQILSVAKEKQIIEKLEAKKETGKTK